MVDDVRLYAWAAPAMDADFFPDHTWVTTYDNRRNAYPDIDAVVAAGESFWYSWGNFRANGGAPGNKTGALGDAVGDKAVAVCLAEPNRDCRSALAARGTIFRYGINGVCHQLANQILYPTGTPTAAALTVKLARGYWASTFRYGVYGVPAGEWDRKRDACGKSRASSPDELEEEAMKNEADEFEDRARSLLKDEDPKLLTKFLALRREAQGLSAELDERSKASHPDAINAANQRMLDRAAKLLGPVNFERIFEFPPEQKVHLVQPDLMEAPAKSTYYKLGGRKKPSKSTDAMTKARLIESINKTTHLSKKDVKEVLETLTDIGHKELRKNGVFLVPGFAKFVVVKKPATKARKGTNPFTGEEMVFKARPARRVLRARPVKTAKDAVKGSLG